MQTVATPPVAQASPQGFNAAAVIDRQRAYFNTGATRPLAFRMAQLRTLRAAIKQWEPKILAALKADLNKCAFEGYGYEAGFVIEDLNHVLAHLPAWVRPQRVPGTLAFFPLWGRVYAEPYGVALVIAPWNYPFQLAMAPLVGAMTAGNTCILKPSELAPHTAQVIADLVAQTFAPEYITVVQGGVPETTALLQQKTDYIFYTGSTTVGKVMMRAAAEHLTPVTLELGGKSPCIVDATADLDVSAKRIAWGKFANAGQTCVAPDYLLLHHAIARPFMAKLEAAITRMYGTDAAQSPDYGRIINERHFNRLRDYLAQGTVVYGGQTDAATKYIAPTLLAKPDLQAAVMQDEIFGPILPVLEYTELDEAIRFVNARPKPLALYVFTKNSTVERRVLAEASFGGGCVNDTLIHLAVSDMPFGGVGASGMGGYHGKASFDTFSHRKSVAKKPFMLDLPVRYAPYNQWSLRLLKMFMG
jgi:acyl-CoA reductase-like NAD-dependent aldehyde dehydrogenase